MNRLCPNGSCRFIPAVTPAGVGRPKLTLSGRPQSSGISIPRQAELEAKPITAAFLLMRRHVARLTSTARMHRYPCLRQVVLRP